MNFLKRPVLVVLGVAALLAAVGWQQLAPTPASASPDHEVWVTVQGTHKVHAYVPKGNGDVSLAFTLDYLDPTFEAQWGVHRNPHMILFGLHGLPGSRYGYISNVSSASTTIIDAHQREVVTVLSTGPRTHAVQASPDGARALAVAIGGGGIAKALCDGSGPISPSCGRVTEILTDAANGTFTLGRTFALHEFIGEPGADTLLRFDPICGSYTPDSQFFYVTLDSGGLVVFRINADPAEPLFSVERIYEPGTGAGQIAAHGCGVGYSSDGTKMFANSGGLPGTPNYQSFYYVFDIATHDLIYTGSLQGHVEDVHGMMLTPAGSPYGDKVVMAGRVSNNFIVIDQTDHEQIVGNFGTGFRSSQGRSGDAPDLVDFSPDGRWLYVSHRGRNPATGSHDISRRTPGLSVVDFATQRVVTITSIPGSPNVQDPHGLAVRRLTIGAAARGNPAREHRNDVPVPLQPGAPSAGEDGHNTSSYSRVVPFDR